MLVKLPNSALAVVMSTCLVVAPEYVSASDNVIRISTSGSDISRIDPHRATSTTDKGMVGWMFNGLVRFPPGSADPNDLEPDLAESWTVSEDGTEYVFTLREGVHFHGDWGQLTAEDVVYSINRASNPETSSFAGAYNGIESVEALDDHTVRIKLEFPVPGFLGLVANYHGGNIVSKRASQELGADFNSGPIGTGPFEFVEHVTQQFVELRAHENYFRGRPELDGVLYSFIASEASRELAFTSGEMDLIMGRREQRWVDATREVPGNAVEVFWPAEFRTVHLNRTIPPLDDVRVRRAIAHAINVDDIIRFVGPDIGPRGCSVVPTGYLGEDCSGWTVDFSIEKARELLTEAGHPDGITMTAVVSNIRSQLPIMEIIQAQLADAGITMNMNVVDHPTYHELIRQNLSAVTFYGAARFPVADSYLTEFYHSDAIVGKPTAITNFSHCDVADAEIEAARRAPTEDQQLAYWAEAQRLIHEAVCAVPLFNLRQVWLRHDGVDLGYELTGAMNLAPPIIETTTVTRP